MHQNLCWLRRLNLLNLMTFLVESPHVSFLLLAWHLTLTSLNSVIKRPLHAIQVLHVFLTFPIPTSIILGLSITLASLSPLSTIPMIQLWLPCIEIKNYQTRHFFLSTVRRTSSLSISLQKAAASSLGITIRRPPDTSGQRPWGTQLQCWHKKSRKFESP